MKRIVRILNEPFEKVELHTFADWHRGDKHCDLLAIQAEVDHVLNTPNAFAIVNGDIMNNATKTSVSDSYAENLTPTQQLTWAADFLAPLAKAGKILAINDGNHEFRTYNKEGIKLTYLLARELGIPEAYGGEGCVIFLRFGHPRSDHGDPNRKICYVIYATHGRGGGRKEGAKAIRLADMASIIDADVYIHSHTHLPMIMKEDYFRTSPHTNSIQCCERLFVNSAAKLQYGGYGQVYEFKPASTSSPVITLYGDVKYASARL